MMRSAPGRLRPAWATVLVLCSMWGVACSDDSTPVAPPPVETDAADRAALIALFHATGGPDWRENEGWNTAAAIRDWHGVRTNGAGFVTDLDLSANRLSGSLPAELGNLAQLQYLDLSDNALNGPIPPELGALDRLLFLSLDRNRLTGSIPPALGNLARLDSLQLAFNALTGPIPAELGNLTALKRLLLAWNELSGPVPPALGQLSNLRYMSLSRNRLTGQVPPELGALASIGLLSLSRNDLTGGVPPELSALAELEGLYLYDNALTGEIPVELGELSRLETLWLHQNRLSGPIPLALTRLSALQDLRLETNLLSGRLPEALGEMQALTRLSLAENSFEGALPPALGRLQELETFRVQGNAALAGLLPRELLDLGHLQALSYARTGLCAQIDREFQGWLTAIPAGDRSECEAGQVERLALDRFFAATGGPGWSRKGGWEDAAALAERHGVALREGRVTGLSLAGNGIAGALPPELVNLTALQALNLEDNRLSGALAPIVAWPPPLVTLRLAGNDALTGPLPFALRELTALDTLGIDRTGLCASPAGSFQSWLAGIADWRGAICPNPDEITVALELAYLVQSVQEPRRRVSLVANREALLRVFLTADEPRGFFEPEVVATFMQGEQTLHRAVMTRSNDRIPAAPEEGRLGQSWNAVIPATAIVPGVTMVVEADPAGTLPLTPASRTRWPETGADSLRVVTASPLELTLVPVVEAANPDSSVVLWSRNLTGDSPSLGLLRHAFPISELEVSTHPTYATSLDLTTEAGQHELLGELEMLREMDNGTGHYYGVAASRNGFVRGWGQISGWISMGKAIPVELAHEIGHNLSLRHAPCGNPRSIDPSFPYPDGRIGVWGYDFRNGNLLAPNRSRDLMSYCLERPWLSDYHHRRVIDYRAELPADRPAGVAAQAEPTDLLVLWGGVLNGEPRLNPPLRMRGQRRLANGSGPWRVAGSGGDGRILFAIDFAMREDGYGGGHFHFAVPMAAEWAGTLERIALSGPAGQVTVTGEDPRRVTVVTERGPEGRLRAILRDWEGPIPAIAGDPATLQAVTLRAGEALRQGR